MDEPTKDEIWTDVNNGVDWKVISAPERPDDSAVVQDRESVGRRGNSLASVWMQPPAGGRSRRFYLSAFGGRLVRKL